MGIKQFLPNKNLYRSLKRIKDIFFRYDIEENVIVFYKYYEVNKAVFLVSYCLFQLLQNHYNNLK